MYNISIKHLIKVTIEDKFQSYFNVINTKSDAFDLLKKYVVDSLVIKK